MGPTLLREEVPACMRAFQTLAGFAQYDGLTNVEREVVVNFVRTRD